MQLMRPGAVIRRAPWYRFRYNLTTGIGENGVRVTGSPEHIALAYQIAQDGIVLLKNDDLLPLKSGSKVALFGIATLDYIKTGGGSGYAYPAYIRDIYEGMKLKADRVSVYEPIIEYYLEKTLPSLPKMDLNVMYDDPELPPELVKDAAEHCDVAVITIRRYTKEGADRKLEKGDYYLSDNEKKTVEAVSAAFQSCVVVLNMAAPMDISWAMENPSIKAIVMAGHGGMEGGLAVADVLVGDVNPSGKLVDTFAKRYEDYPSSDTFNESDDYVNYYEDIYVGYRYFETIPNASETVYFPFGFGLSYTTFDISHPVVAVNGESIEVSVSVKNTGACAGREVVQIYYSAPQGKLGKSAVELAAFQKTRLLAPGEQQDISLTFPIKDMASYDDVGKCQMSAYVLEGGEYRFFAGRNCRDLIEAEFRYVVAEEFVVVDQLTQRCAPNQLARRMLADGSFEAVPSFPILEHSADPYVNTAEPLADEKVVPFDWVVFQMVTLDTFMTQLTDDEMVELLYGVPSRGAAFNGGFGDNKRLGIPALMTADGPVGIHMYPYTNMATTAFPATVTLASTWDTELAEEMGKVAALEAFENGFAVWLAPALNIHRNPLCGRNYEYFSEDPLIAGKFAAAIVRGAQSKKIACSAKHFMANNKEANRFWCDSRVSERALREIYMRGFEICVKEAQPWTIMTSYNLVNARRCCESWEQITGVLRNEWGFEGLVTSDWRVPCDDVKRVLAGNDIYMPGNDMQPLKDALKDGRITRGQVEACVRRLLKMFLKLA